MLAMEFKKIESAENGHQKDKGVEGGKEEFKEFEDVLRRIGQWGHVQRIQLVLLACVVMATCVHNMGMVVLGGVPMHHCAAPPGYDSNESMAAVYNDPIPFRNKNGKSIMSECEVFDVNVSTRRRDNSTRTVPCREKVGHWVYDNSTFDNTIVSEWDLVCDAKWMRAFSQMVYFFGYFIGCVVVANFSDRFGRLLTMAVCSAIQVVSGVATVFSPNFAVFTSLRFMLGFATGGQRNSAFVLGQEWSTEDMRVLTNIMNGVAWDVAHLILGLLTYLLRDWRYIELACSVPMFIFVLYYWILYPSPRWLITKGRDKEAKAILIKASKRNGRPLSDDVNLSTISFPKKVETSLLDPLRTPNMRCTSFIVWLNWFVVGMVYFGLAYNVGNFVGDFYVNHSIMGVTGFSSAIIYYIIMKFGRRWPLFGIMIAGGVFNLLVMLTSGDYPTITIILACVGRISAGVGFQVLYVYSGEVYPTSIRTIGLGTGSMFARVGGMVAPYIVVLADTMATIPYIVFGTFGIIGGLFALYLPETQGRRLMDNIEDAERYNRLYCRCREQSADETVDDRQDEPIEHVLPLLKTYPREQTTEGRV